MCQIIRGTPSSRYEDNVVSSDIDVCDRNRVLGFGHRNAVIEKPLIFSCFNDAINCHRIYGYFAPFDAGQIHIHSSIEKGVVRVGHFRRRDTSWVSLCFSDPRQHTMTRRDNQRPLTGQLDSRS